MPKSIFHTYLTPFAVLVLTIQCFAAPSLSVTPGRALIDTPLRLVVDGLQPGQEFLIRGIIRLDGENAYISQARFRADAQGRTDTENAVPLEGSSYERGPMGLVWSMKEERLPIRLKDDPSKQFRPLEAFDILFEVEVDGQIVANARASRLFVDPSVVVAEVREPGLAARLFTPASKEKLAAVITLGGSEGGIETAAFRGMLLASHGYAALAVAYFKFEGLPNELDAIPLETIERARDYLAKRPEVDAGRIGIVGSSRGAEMALLAASAFPGIKALVAYAPNNYSLAAIVRGPQRAAWTLNGQPLPFVPTPPEAMIAGFKRMSSATDFPSKLAGQMLLWSHAVEKAAIPVENINSAVLIISGRDDKLFPSSEMADLIIARLKEKGFRHPAVQLSFEAAGHLITAPFLPTPPRVQLGGTPEGLATADTTSWKRLLEFLAENLRTR